ncbi:hypothetical protein VNO77_40394 [Canavalia gladiata]|uniref:Uncharacterized protein n=1 Tax=Canavalia gladiata TaxID=3824 RepID=A0AAN9PRI5_CANGL
MVGFSNTEESAIDEIIAQAQDACVLEELSAINCAGITNSVLPTHLESRFCKLKSFPPTKPHEIQPHNFSTFSSRNFHHTNDENKMGLQEKPKHPSVSVSVSVSSPPFGSVSASSPSSQESSMSSLFRPTQKDQPKLSKQNSLSSKSLRGSPSPPRKTGCFWCSPKKNKKNKENWVAGDDELLSELGTFSMKQQQKILKKAMKEQEKINREAQKIVEWAKNASARINISDIEDEFSD